jgi:integrase/recombinase XerD
MIRRFNSAIASELLGFLQFKRSLGYRYTRAEFTLREFDRFLLGYVKGRRVWHLDQAMLSWLESKPHRKAVSVSMDAAVLRQLCSYLRRCPAHTRFRDPFWPRLPMESKFVPHVLSSQDVQRLLDLTSELKRPPFRAILYRCLILVLYCTGLRFGEALHLRMRDVDPRSKVLFVEPFKGRARWVPFHPSLAPELNKYVTARRAFAPALPDDRFFVGINQRSLPRSTAFTTLVKLFREAGLKPKSGRIGPRPYDLRHTFAVHRLTRWYRRGADLQARLPWLSAYMGHDDILGTETYLTATPALLDLAGNRFRRHYLAVQTATSEEP